jgi:hypothetical protein
MTISMTYGPVEPSAGQAVTFTLQVTDRDAPAQMIEVDFGDGPAQHVIVDCAARYGPWDPPARSGGTKTFTYTHTYRRAGTYTTHFTASSKGCDNPYGNTLDIRQPITVDAAATPDPSPSESPTPFP